MRMLVVIRLDMLTRREKTPSQVALVDSLLEGLLEALLGLG